MTDQGDVTTSKKTAEADLKGLDAGTFLHEPLSEQVEAEIIGDWTAATSTCLEANLRRQMKKQP